MIRENKQDSKRSDCPSPHLAASCHLSGSAQFSELHVLAQITSCQHPSRIRGCQAVSTYDVDSESLVVPFPSGNGLLLGVFPWLANTASSVQNTNSKAHSVTALIAVIIKKQKTRLKYQRREHQHRTALLSLTQDFPHHKLYLQGHSHGS